jgi:hypothetical protein
MNGLRRWRRGKARSSTVALFLVSLSLIAVLPAVDIGGLIIKNKGTCERYLNIPPQLPPRPKVAQTESLAP